MSLELPGVNAPTKARVSIFKNSGGSWETWNRLPEESMAMMIAIGGGGGVTGGAGGRGGNGVVYIISW